MTRTKTLASLCIYVVYRLLFMIYVSLSMPLLEGVRILPISMSTVLMVWDANQSKKTDVPIIIVRSHEGPVSDSFYSAARRR